jgi:hypothetical protein
MRDHRVVHGQKFQGFGVEEPHRNGIALEDQFERFFRLISLGHVLVCPDPADRRAMLIQNQFGFVMNPSHRAARLDDAKVEVNARLVRKLASGGGLVSGSLRFTRGAIVGMKESEESFPHGRGQIRIETEDLVGFAEPFDGARPQVLLDAAGMGDPLSARQMVRAALEPLRLARGP